jgi:hypothetical protein
MTYLISVITSLIIAFSLPEDFSLVGLMSIGVLIGMNGFMAWHSFRNHD